MKLSPIALVRILLSGILVLSSSVASAKDELLIYVFQGGEPVESAEVIVDGVPVGVTRQDGSLVADLGEGGHVVAVEALGKRQNVRVASDSGQLIDIAVDIDSQDGVKVDVYSGRESVAERRGKAQGALQVTVTRDGAPVEGVVVSLSGGGGVASTNAQGVATANVPRGRYTLTVDGQQYNVRVFAGVARGASVALASDSVDVAVAAPVLEEVFVVGSFDPTAFEVSERDTDSIVDTLGVEQLTRFGDTDVAASIVRVPGISVQDSKYVFIRGLGDRYVTSTLNNATMPSTNPSKRTVPLDLFPSNFVNQLDIKKSFLPYMPGESTGGNLVINTKTFPDERGGGIRVSTGLVSGLTGNSVAADPGDGGFDWLGWDDGTREENIAVQTIADLLSAGTFTDADGDTFDLNQNVRGELLRVAGVLISDDWDPSFKNAEPNASFGANYGDVFYIGDAELGVFVAGNYSNSWEQRDSGVRRTREPSGFLADEIEYKSVTNLIDTSALASIGLNIGDSTYEWNSFLSRSTESFVEQGVGVEGDEFASIYQHTIQWEERQFLSTQIIGSHFLNADGSLFAEWQFTASQARRYVPQRTDVRFRARQSLTDGDNLRNNYEFGVPNREQTTLLQGFEFEDGNSAKRWDDLTDNNFDFSVNVTWDVFDAGDSYGVFKAGAQTISRERDVESATYGYFNNGLNASLDRSPNVAVSDVIYVCGEGSGAVQCPLVVADNGDISPAVGGVQDNAATGFVFQIRTAASDVYEADLQYDSVYLMYDHNFNSDWQIVGGVRVEDYLQETDTFSLATSEPIASVIDEQSVLPSLGVNWRFADTQQLRLAVSKTVARPDFKETANSQFFENEFNVIIRGNPLLDISEVTNLDLRWEWYFGDNDKDQLSVAGFLKEMEDPIERVVQPASGTAGNSRTFRNALDAEIYGIEVEGRKEFLLGAGGSTAIFIDFNAAYIESDVTLENGETSVLQGAPEYTGNLVIGYDNFATGHQLTLLYNANGAYIADRGLQGLPDIFLEARGELNLIYRYDLSEAVTLRAKVENLLDEPVEYTQGGDVFQSYDKGMNASIGFDWSL